jgi:hypothetical protein
LLVGGGGVVAAAISSVNGSLAAGANKSSSLEFRECVGTHTTNQIKKSNNLVYAQRKQNLWQMCILTRWQVFPDFTVNRV